MNTVTIVRAITSFPDNDEYHEESIPAPADHPHAELFQVDVSSDGTRVRTWWWCEHEEAAAPAGPFRPMPPRPADG